ncbi:hypothetical protein EELLY_v1c03550 [Entomoplasma ellychniae]|uniref:Uncharacterized protein n=1 Tax=Entomoplasma ellychniae TaxID=2114 RepID=A0A8E2QZE1_9MOLU|nr:ECF transporter S component [Entomoplasma ellychniae]PPE04675.1 hypothetical protein EELLY_v1c03550 [Entomoplasma ellychniae]
MKSKNSEFYNVKITKGIDGFNLKARIKNYFYLSTRQISLLSLLLAFEMVVVLISKFTLGFWIIGGAYTIELAFFPIIFIALIFNWFYTSIIAVISVWFRTLLGSEPIGLISLTIADLSFLIVFCCLFYTFKKMFNLLLSNNQILKYSFWIFISGVIASVVSSLISLVCNYLFIFNLYNMPPTQWILWLGVLITNIKYLLNIAVCCYLFKVLSKILKSFNISA